MTGTYNKVYILKQWLDDDFHVQSFMEENQAVKYMQL
jgi:hypothetical protein